MTKALGICAAITVFLSSTALTQSKNDKTVVGKVGKQNVTYSELKNNVAPGRTTSPSLEELEEFLPVYLNYVAKIQFAEDQGIMADEQLNNELEIYSKQAAYSYWLDKRIKATEFEKYYDRASKEVKSEHILIAVGTSATPADTLEAYNKLIEARNRFLAGESLLSLDPEYSSKQNGRSMGGDLPWFGIGTSVKEFEDVIYTLDVGEISMPFRSQFGYHIVHVQDKRERKPSVNVSHIYTRGPEDDSKPRIDRAFNALNEGRTWEEVVIELSDDDLSKSKKGNVGWINYGRYNSEFVDQVMSLDPDKEYSEPIKTVYGYHIFKVDSVQAFGSEEEKRETYMQQFLDSQNFQKSNSFVINWFKNEYPQIVNTEVLNRYESYIRSKGDEVIKVIATPPFKNETVYTFKNYSFSINDLHEYLKSTQKGVSGSNYQDAWFEGFKTYSIDTKVTEMALNEFPEFDAEVQNYKKGLAVFQVNDKYLWSAETVDSTILMDRYNTNVEKYSYRTRYYYHLISARQDSNLQKAMDFVLEGNSPDSIRTVYKMVAVSKDSSGTFTEEPFNMLSSVKEGSFSDKFDYRNRNARFYLNRVLPARRMTFEEAFPLLLTDYQPEREEKWLEQLKEKYKIKPDVKKLRTAYNKDSK